MEPTGMEWTAEVWRYAGEGGTHALFEYVGTSTDLSGYLLNLSKADLARSDQWVTVTADHAAGYASSKAIKDNILDDLFCFVRDIVTVNISSRYIDLPRPVSLPWSFLKLLRQTALSGDDIPPRRRHGWSMKKQEDQMTMKVEKMARGLLLPNYKRWRLQHSPHPTIHSLQSTTSTDCIAIEIKPKAGYTAVSPLVHPHRRIKYLRTRFALLQDLHVQGLVQKAWSSSSSSIDDIQPAPRKSEYNPLDLFSNDHSRIFMTLQSLVACPQNNIRVWCRGNFCLGVGRNGADTIIDWNYLADYLGVDHEQAQSILMEALTSILVQEPLLEQLLELQVLDVVDADGAILLYERLEKLLDGSDEVAQAMLDDYAPKSAKRATEISDQPELHPLLASSPLDPPDDASRINTYCALVDDFQRALVSVKILPKTSYMDSARNSARAIISSFEKHDCCYLLQNWLLSLAMCDVSFFVRCRRADRNARTISAAVAIQDGQPGTVILSSPPMLLQYDMKLIDCDYKPAKKLRDRLEKELLFNQLSIIP